MIKANVLGRAYLLEYILTNQHPEIWTCFVVFDKEQETSMAHGLTVYLIDGPNH